MNINPKRNENDMDAEQKPSFFFGDFVACMTTNGLRYGRIVAQTNGNITIQELGHLFLSTHCMANVQYARIRPYTAREAMAKIGKTLVYFGNKRTYTPKSRVMLFSAQEFVVRNKNGVTERYARLNRNEYERNLPEDDCLAFLAKGYLEEPYLVPFGVCEPSPVNAPDDFTKQVVSRYYNAFDEHGHDDGGEIDLDCFTSPTAPQGDAPSISDAPCAAD